MDEITEEVLTPFLFEDIKTSERPEIILANVPEFKELMMQYECAIMEVNTKLHVLNNEFSHMHQRNPIESIKTRIKTPASILEKPPESSDLYRLAGKWSDRYRRYTGHLSIS